jgi:S-adenosylmethionine-dependent methyltransferase
MFVDDPRPLVRSLVKLSRTGGVVSVLAKNAAALALRPALQGRYAEALARFDVDRDVGALGVVHAATRSSH